MRYLLCLLIIRSILTDRVNLSAKASVLIGDVDTVGFTYYDWQLNAHPYRMIVNDPRYGIHVT